MNGRKSLGGLSALLVLAVAVIGVVILGVSLLSPRQTPEVPPEVDTSDRTPLIRVDDTVITRFDLAVARAYERLRKAKASFVLPDHGLLREMVDLAAWEAILRRHGRSLTNKEIVEERARQVRDSRDPGLLRDIIALLDRYPGKYEEIMVRRSLANQAIMKLHQDKSVQTEPFAKAESGLQEALRDPDYFRRMKEESPMMYRREDSEHPTMGAVNPGVPLPPDQDEVLKRQLRDFAKRYLSTLEVGKVCPEVIDGDGAFVVTRLLERKGDDVVYENVIFFKIPFDTWYSRELRKLKGEILDPETRTLIKDKLSENAIGPWLLGEPLKSSP